MFCILLGFWLRVWFRSRPRNSRAEDPAAVKQEQGTVWARYPLRHAIAEIRLLEIVSPTSLDKAGTDPIIVRFCVVSLKEQPKYHALSYVWGDPTDTEAITVQLSLAGDKDLIETRLNVTRNLARALRYLHGHHENLRSNDSAVPVPLRIWINALCINQQDPVELGQQVAMMKEIYASADTVFASMSPDENFASESLERVFEGIPLLNDMLQDMKTEGELFGLEWLDRHDVFNRRDIQAKTAEDEARYKEDVQLVTNHMWDLLSKFPKSTYFKRIWILQEMCLANKLLFIYNTHLINWETIFIVFFRLDEISLKLQENTNMREIKATNNKDFRPFIHNKLATRSVNGRLSWLRYLNDTSRQKNGLDLDDKWTVARLVQTMDATQPKDYVYGILGLTGFDITPNYQENVSVDRVYAEQVAAWLSDWPILTTQQNNQSMELDFLAHSGLGVPLRDGATHTIGCSWVPALQSCNFNATIRAIPTCARSVQALQTTPSASISLEPLELSISGVVVGQSKQPDPVPINQQFRPEFFMSVFIRYIIGYTPSNMMFFNSFITGERPLENFPYQSPMLNLFRLSTLLDISEDKPLFLTYTLHWLSTRTGLLADLEYTDEGHAVCDGKHWRDFQVQPSVRFIDWYAENFSSKAMHLKALEEMLDVANSVEGKRRGDSDTDDSDTDEVNSGGGRLRPHIPTYLQHMSLIGENERVADYQRRTIQTTSGLLGIGPQEIQEGDILVVFKESGQPHMLRRSDCEGKGNRWLHVGQCFVPELLHGEAGALGAVERFVLV